MTTAMARVPLTTFRTRFASAVRALRDAPFWPGALISIAVADLATPTVGAALVVARGSRVEGFFGRDHSPSPDGATSVRYRPTVRHPAQGPVEADVSSDVPGTLMRPWTYGCTPVVSADGWPVSAPSDDAVARGEPSPQRVACPAKDGTPSALPILFDAGTAGIHRTL